MTLRNPRALAALLVAALLPGSLAAQAAPTPAAAAAPTYPTASTTDPRVALAGGRFDARYTVRNLELVTTVHQQDGWFNPNNLGDFAYLSSDLAFRGDLLWQGSFHGIRLYDISDPTKPRLRSSMVCPGGQGDVSVRGNLMFMSVEEPRGRVDCGAQGVREAISKDRFTGVRIFDISNVDAPKQIAAVQTCRGSHTHTIFESPRDTKAIYVFVSGVAPVRSADEVPGCSSGAPDKDKNTSRFRVEVIRVPLDQPSAAKVVGTPRIFANAAGEVNGLWRGGNHGANTQNTAETDQCHDITVYAQIGLAAGACSGNGILLDIRDPANPRRVADVSDPNFAYWHSATFNNEGTTVLFSDEWGGGVAPRCRATDRLTWGADALFKIGADRKMTFAGHYKLPAAQGNTENCVAHNGSLIPVPGRDIMTQAWYQGGVSVFDFTDPAHPFEIAYFDRGPLDTARTILSGQWSTYWYNGYIYGSEIARGLDVFQLVPSGLLTQNEIDAAKLAKVDALNPQDQKRITWPAHFSVAKAYLDQLSRSGGLPGDRFEAVTRDLAAAEAATGAARQRALTALAAALDRDARTSGDAARVRAMAGVLRQLAR